MSTAQGKTIMNVSICKHIRQKPLLLSLNFQCRPYSENWNCFWLRNRRHYVINAVMTSFPMTRKNYNRKKKSPWTIWVDAQSAHSGIEPPTLRLRSGLRFHLARAEQIPQNTWYLYLSYQNWKWLKMLRSRSRLENRIK